MGAVARVESCMVQLPAEGGSARGTSRAEGAMTLAAWMISTWVEVRIRFLMRSLC